MPPSLANRYLRALLSRPSGPRPRAGYSFWQRYWVSLTGAALTRQSSAPGMLSVHGYSSPAKRTRPGVGEFDDPSREPADEDSGSGGGSGEPPDGLSGPADEAGSLPGNLGDSPDETDWEATRYLAAATQLDLKYARSVVRQIIGEPFRAVAPAAGADVAVVTRWALAALRRRALRDAVLTCLLIGGVTTAVGAWTWIPIVVMAALAVFVVAYEQWVRDAKILARLMLRGRFRACVCSAFTKPTY